MMKLGQLSGTLVTPWSCRCDRSWTEGQLLLLQHTVTDNSEKWAWLCSNVPSHPDLPKTVISQITRKFLEKRSTAV